MAYRTDINNRDRGGAIAAVIAIHAALLVAFAHISGKFSLPQDTSVLRVFDVTTAPPPPPPPPRQNKQSRTKETRGGSAPPNLRSEATPVAAPVPKINVRPAPQIAATQTPRQGAAPTQGASNMAGPGTGAGGIGTGTGSGAGAGSGGDNGVAEPPHLLTPVLTGRDFPGELLNAWPRGATVFLRLRVDERGYVSECALDRGTGIASIDSSICNLAHERLRFRPALNLRGEAVAGWFGYAQRAPQ